MCVGGTRQGSGCGDGTLIVWGTWRARRWEGRTRVIPVHGGGPGCGRPGVVCLWIIVVVNVTSVQHVPWCVFHRAVDIADV